MFNRWVFSRSFSQKNIRPSVKHLFQPRNERPWNKKRALNKESTETESGGKCKSHRLFVDNGIIRPAIHAEGTFHYLPLGLRALNKLTVLIEDCLANRVEGVQKVLLPSLTSAEWWKESGRWDSLGSELFRVRDRHGDQYALNPTHEEAVTSLVAGLPQLSHWDLPLGLFQTSVKFRDESSPKWGLLRGREFVMNDLYTFDADEDSAGRTYQRVTEAYVDIFERIGVPYRRLEADGGLIGGSLSHEFLFPCDIGEDECFVCPECDRHSRESKCDKMTLTKAVEVGHTFLLGERYSRPLKARYSSSSSQSGAKENHLQMGCYGIGVSRILAASVEILSPNDEIRWPDVIAPFSVLVIAPNTGLSDKFNDAFEVSKDVFDKINGEIFPDDALFDDRNDVSVGGKLRQAKRTGYTFILLFGKDFLNPTEPLLEFYDLSRNSATKVSVETALDYLRRWKK